ncbi:glycosyltransferase family 2 protein [Globicatella sanguinis]
MENNSVSMIIPTYGGSLSLKRAIDSVINQNYPQFNIIVVDDNNPNSEGRKKTEEIMKDYVGNNKVIYIKHDKNMNGSAARNTGANHSDAEYLCFIDDDDISYPGRIIKQVKFLNNHPEYDACYCWAVRQNKEIKFSLTGDLTKSLLDLSFSPQTSTIMFRHLAYSEINGFDERYRRHQDYEFLLRFYKNHRIGVVEEILVQQMRNEINNQLTGKDLLNLKEYFFENFGHEVEEINKLEPGYKKHVYAAHFSGTCKELLRHGNILLAIKTYCKYGYIGGLEFWNRLFKLIGFGVKKKILRISK